ncbi:MAG: hypothetical protein IPM76_15495 [Chloroflexi bacterium]|nr:hypothetical protein [Chloroflexota bacterium]
MLHKEFAQALNVVIIVKTHIKTGAWAHVVLFSSDLTLDYDRLVIIIACGSKSSSIFVMPNNTGAWKIS